jgi:hypothetical protein
MSSSTVFTLLDPVVYEVDSKTAAGLSLCTTIHHAVFAAQVEFLRDTAHSLKLGTTTRISSDPSSSGTLSGTFPPSLDRIASSERPDLNTDFECTVASLLNHEDLISSVYTIHDLAIVMAKLTRV